MSESLVEAEAQVAAERARHSDDSRRPEMASALLQLSRALDDADRGREALEAARKSVTTLAPAFLAQPASLATAMRQLVTAYVALCQRSGTAPDQALLTPIAQALGDRTRAEDIDDDA